MNDIKKGQVSGVSLGTKLVMVLVNVLVHENLKSISTRTTLMKNERSTCTFSSLDLYIIDILDST